MNKSPHEFLNYANFFIISIKKGGEKSPPFKRLKYN